MKKLILVLIFLIGLVNISESQTRLKFGDVFLKDTLSGSLKITTGGLYINSTDSLKVSGITLRSQSIYGLNAGIHLYDNVTTIISDGDDIDYTVTHGTHKFNDNVIIDSILTLRSSATINLISDDTLITITSSCMIMTSDDATATNRTFTISDGATAGQLLIIEWIGAVGSKEGEIVDAGSESGLNGTMTFDALDDTIMLKWTGTYWRELSRTEH